MDLVVTMKNTVQIMSWVYLIRKANIHASIIITLNIKLGNQNFHLDSLV